MATDVETLELRSRLSCAMAGWSDRPWLCLISGGSDSTALAYLAAAAADEWGAELAYFHANHHLRGEASDGDAAFAARLAAGLDRPLYTADLDLDEALAAGANLEALARRARYDAANEALDRWCGRCGIEADQGLMLVAHTLDDRIENLFMRTLVGTGPGGFRGMVRREGRLIRPLLDATRAELRAYLAALPDAIVDVRSGMRWCEDATNDDVDRLRAFVRHSLIPLAETRSPSLPAVLRRTMDLIADEDDYMESLAREAAERHLQWLGGNNNGRPTTDDGFHLTASFGMVAMPVARRVVRGALSLMAGRDQRVDTRAVEGVLGAFDQGKPLSGYVANIQGDLAVSANKRGVTVEPMAIFRARRKPDRASPAGTKRKEPTDE